MGLTGRLNRGSRWRIGDHGGLEKARLNSGRFMSFLLRRSINIEAIAA